MLNHQFNSIEAKFIPVHLDSSIDINLCRSNLNVPWFSGQCYISTLDSMITDKEDDCSIDLNIDEVTRLTIIQVNSEESKLIAKVNTGIISKENKYVISPSNLLISITDVRSVDNNSINIKQNDYVTVSTKQYIIYRYITK